MTSRDDKSQRPAKGQPRDDDALADDALALLAGEDGDEDLDALDEMAARVEQPGMQERILSRYLAFGRDLLGDSSPTRLDPRIIARLEPILGDVSHVRVHSGELASSAVRAMDARAFAIGDKDIFVDQRELDPHSAEGRALLAHEVAHTTDAATGFALSAHHKGASKSDREAFAETIEARVFAMEDDFGTATLDEGQGIDASRAVGGNELPAEPKVDKAKLLARVWEILARQQTRSAERNGIF